MRLIHIIADKLNIRKRTLFIITVICTVMLAGCGKVSLESLGLSDIAGFGNKASEQTENVYEDVNGGADTGIIDQMEQEDNDSIEVYDTNGMLLETQVSVIDAGSEPKGTVEIYAKDIVSSGSTCNHNTCYAYGTLNADQQNTYREIYAVITGMQDDVLLSSVDTDEIDVAFKCVMIDHPDIFYVKGYSLGKYMYGDVIDRISISGTYTMTKADVEKKQQDVEQYITNVIEKAPRENDYDKIKYVYEYLIRTNEYDASVYNNQNILSIIDSSRTVCQGYAKMTQLLLNRMGMFCTLINGEACGNSGSDVMQWGPHVWNVVRCNGKYYNVDTTWGDASFALSENEPEAAVFSDINYEFLLVDDAEISGTHIAEPVVSVPACNTMEDNYYRHEGLYFSDINELQLQSAFDKAYAEGEKIVGIKASDDSVYTALENYLIKDQNIFRYIVLDNVKYVEYPERRMILISI